MSSIKFQTIIISILLLSLVFSSANATRPPDAPTDRTWSDPRDSHAAIRPDDMHRLPRRDLDNYIGQLERTCMFLDSMQEHNAEDRNFGGLHEGESNALWRIVETDNTQESIRVWCEYAAYFNDPDRFRQNVDDAWTYCDSFPAWEESAPGEMYGLHNSGWGLIAEIGFRATYQDTSRRWYGINCANHLVEHTPDIEVDMEDNLMPLVAGWAAGTLYQYGMLEDNEEYRDAAINIGEQVKAWIDSDLNRLHANEVWALSGGTAMWGVLKSVGQVDSAGTADWAIEALEQMDVFAGRGNWNNSWNIWYSHAWLEAYRLVGDDAYRENVITIVDSLVAQDGDHDGGISATGGNPDDADESWVSAYTAWMGLRQLFDVLPEVDASVVQVVAPLSHRPYPVGSPMEFTFQLVNAGSAEEVDVPLQLSGMFEYDTVVTISGWQPNNVTLSAWTPQEAGDFTLTVFTEHRDDFDRSDDTIFVDYEIRDTRRTRFYSRSFGGQDRGYPGCRFDLYSLEFDQDDLFASFRVEQGDRDIGVNLMLGSYKVAFIPDFPFAPELIDSFVNVDRDQNVEGNFYHPEILLVDRNVDSSYVKYYEEPLSALGYRHYRWSSPDLGAIPEEHPGMEGFNTIIYFTGDRSEETIREADRQYLASVEDKNLFITGQNILDEFAEDDFLRDVLHCERLSNDLRAGRLESVQGDEVFHGMSMLLIGNNGANNQDSPAGIRAVGNGIDCITYVNHPDTAAAVRWTNESGSKGIFFAFGFEGISGQVGNSSAQVMRAILEWFGTPTDVTPEIELLPDAVSLSAFPNPFNSSITINFVSPAVGAWDATVYDLTGRQVSTLRGNRGESVDWNGVSHNGLSLPSGMYYVMFEQDGVKLNDGLKVILLR